MATYLWFHRNIAMKYYLPQPASQTRATARRTVGPRARSRCQRRTRAAAQRSRSPCLLGQRRRAASAPLGSGGGAARAQTTARHTAALLRCERAAVYLGVENWRAGVYTDSILLLGQLPTALKFKSCAEDLLVYCSALRQCCHY
jgi:hypothetical protein